MGNVVGSRTRVAGTLLLLTTAVTGIVTGVFNKIGERAYDRVVDNCVKGAGWSVCEVVLRWEGIPLPEKVATANEPQPVAPAVEDPATAPSEGASPADAAPSEVAPAEVQISPRAPGWFPQSSERVLIDADVSGKSCPTLRIMRNEIYARHGHTFKTPEMRRHFAAQPWYVDRNVSADSLLTSIEQQNVRFIRRAETQRECEV